MSNINFADELSSALMSFKSDVEKGLEKAKTEVAKDAVKELRTSSRPREDGDYLKGFARKRVGTAEVIYNRTHPSLTHLLEFGHAKVNGGRVAAIPHLEPVERRAIESFTDRAERIIRG